MDSCPETRCDALQTLCSGVRSPPPPGIVSSPAQRSHSIYSLETVFLVFGSFLAGLLPQQDQAEHFSRNDEVFRT